jgi:outer membrane protein assembly factor BamB
MMQLPDRRSSIALFLLICLAVSGCSLPSWMGGKKTEKVKLAGERIAVLPVGTALTPDAELKDVPVTLPPANANAEWPQHSGFLTPATANLAGGAFDHITSATAGDGEEFVSTLIPKPVVAGGMVFAMDAVGNISAHDASDISKVRWQSKGVSEHKKPQIIGGGLAFADGKLYVVSGRGIVAAFDAATGKEIWRKTMHTPLRSAPKVDGGKIFIVSLDNQFFALNAANGEVIWDHRGIEETAEILKSVSPAVSGETVIAPYSSGEIYALSTTDGKEIWSDSLSSREHTQAGLFSGIGGDPLIDGAVVITVSSSNMIAVYALANGQHLWERPIGSLNTPWLAGDYLFVLSNDNTLVCFAKFSGKIKWASKLQDFAKVKEKREPITWRGPVLSDGRLVVVGSTGQLLLVNAADGKVTSKEIPKNIYTGPVVVGGRMYLIGQDAKLYQLQ